MSYFYDLENFINGEFVAKSRKMESVNPATGKVNICQLSSTFTLSLPLPSN